MANVVKSQQKRFIGGISDYLKESKVEDAFFFARSINYRDDPQSITLLPGSVKESGSTIVDLLKWGDVVPDVSKYYFYGDAGNIYLRTSAGVWSNLHTAADSSGNGLAYFTGDDYLYYSTNSTLGRFGPINSASPQFSDNFLGAQGGIPTNTASVTFASASSQYADAVDSVSLSVTSDLTLEAFFKLNSLPTVGQSMSLMAKWNEATNTRSYKMDIFGVSGYFGDGSSGSVTISADTNQTLVTSACSGTASTQALSATGAFVAGQVIFIHQTQGTNAGQWERNTVNGYTAGTITTGTPMLGSYSSSGSNKAQVSVIPQYINVTVNSGVTWTGASWNGNTGGFLLFLSNGSVNVNGIIALSGVNGTYAQPPPPGATGGGFRGGNAEEQGSSGRGEGTTANGGTGATNNGNGGGGATFTPGQGNASGAGGGNGIAGQSGVGILGSTGGIGGFIAGSTDLTTFSLGGGGGGGSAGGGDQGSGGSGGGCVFISAVSLTVDNTTGFIRVNGGKGGGNPTGDVGGGGGAGGSVLLKCQTAILGTNRILANGGTGGVANGSSQPAGGAGGAGRIHLDYLTSFTGTTTPTLDANQDNTLVTNTTYQARLGVSANGTAFEYLTKNISNLTTGKWNRLSIAWDASAATAFFYLNALFFGSTTGTITSISNNASNFYLGAQRGSAAVDSFVNGSMDDVRIWNTVQSDQQIFANNQTQLTGSEGGLAAYWELNSDYADAGASSNTLTPHNTPIFTADVPFPSPSTRLDIDQSRTGGASTTVLLDVLSEASTAILQFTPDKDPQASIAFNISDKGTGDWTAVIHDQQNNVIAQKTITNANLATSGLQEFIFPTPWRIVIGKEYHAHLYSTVADGEVVSTSSDDLNTADFVTYFGFLVSDTAYHSITPFLNYIAIGNERYVATWDGAFYQPNLIALPPGYRVRCFAYWREYLAIGVWKGNSITDYPFGRVYFWDGIAPTFNFFVDIPDGQVNALFGVEGDLYMMVGYRGYLYDYQGGFSNTGSSNKSTNKLKKMPLMMPTDQVDIYPGALTMWRNLLQIGLAGTSDSTTLQRGVYSWGSYNQNYADTLSYDYPLSTGNTGNTVSIGCVYPTGTQLIVGWRDGIGYGADVIDFNNAPASTGSISVLLQDDGVTWKTKNQLAVRADYLPLKTGEGVEVMYAIDRSPNFVSSTPDTAVGSVSSELQIGNYITTGRGREYQFGVTMTSTGGTSPTLIGVALMGDLLQAEEVF